MKLIIGLGNPGEKYIGTRHNIGFAFLDHLQEAWNFPEFEENTKFKARISSGEKDGEKILLVKPETFMNLSGISVRSVLDFYKLSGEDIAVIHDDLDIPVGKYKIAVDSSSAGHNGVQNIIDALGTQKFKRARVGIGQAKEGAPVCRLNAHNFVLGRIPEEEQTAIEKLFPEIEKEI